MNYTQIMKSSIFSLYMVRFDLVTICLLFAFKRGGLILYQVPRAILHPFEHSQIKERDPKYQIPALRHRRHSPPSAKK